VPQDYAEALRWLRLSAAQGLDHAQYNLGVMYAEGHGVPQNHAEALKLYRLAAAQGNSGAQFSLGKMYLEGRVVPQDFVLAHFWFNLTVVNSQGVPELLAAATHNREVAATKMTPAQIAEAQKLAREWKPTTQ
jgi:TPR repeat protein